MVDVYTICGEASENRKTKPSKMGGIIIKKVYNADPSVSIKNAVKLLERTLNRTFSNSLNRKGWMNDK